MRGAMPKAAPRAGRRRGRHESGLADAGAHGQQFLLREEISATKPGQAARERRRSSLVEVFAAEPELEAFDEEEEEEEGEEEEAKGSVGSEVDVSSGALEANRTRFYTCGSIREGNSKFDDFVEGDEEEEQEEQEEEDDDDVDEDDGASGVSSSFFSASGDDSMESLTDLMSPFAVRYHRFSCEDDLGLQVSIAQGGLQRIRREAQSAQVSLRDIVELFGRSIANMARMADREPRHAQAITTFDGTSVPGISMPDYIWRIVHALNAHADPAYFAADGSELSLVTRCASPRRHASTDSLDVHPSPGETALEGEHSAMGRGLRCLLLALVYIDRACTRHPDAFRLTSVSMHRVILTAMYLAAKFTDDTLPQAHWTFARLGGISCSELRTLEVSFCGLVEYRLYVTEAEFQALCMEQLRCAVRNARELREARRACASQRGRAPQKSAGHHNV